VIEMLTLNKINSIARARNPHFSLYKGEGYFYLVFDDGVRFETLSVCVYRINHLTLEQWQDRITELEDLIKS